MTAGSFPAPASFDARTEIDGDTLLIVVEGELDLASCAALELELFEAEKSDAARIVLDLSELTFIDSTGVALLVDAIKHSDQNAGRLRIKRSDSIGVQRVLQLTGIEGRLPYLD